MTKISTPAAPEGDDSPERTAALDRLDAEQLFADLRDAWDADSRLFFPWANLPAALRERFVAEVLGMVRRYPHAPSEGSLGAERDLCKATERWVREPSDNTMAQLVSASRELVMRRAQDGVPEAQNAAGHMYAQASPLDLVLADRCFVLAAAQGNVDARESHMGLALTMTPEQLAEARRLAQEWKASRP